jgi:thymidylate synthase (FAD)
MAPVGQTADFSIVQAARVSYGAGTKKVNEDTGLIRYLMRHKHSSILLVCFNLVLHSVNFLWFGLFRCVNLILVNIISLTHAAPFEMVEFKFHCVMPIFVARQWIRHRTASVNEYSARYLHLSLTPSSCFL